jgi:hypothetical protein
MNAKKKISRITIFPRQAWGEGMAAAPKNGAADLAGHQNPDGHS